jgi:hypothetical protein
MYKCITFGNYEWYVLDVKDNKALLLSKDVILGWKPYDNLYSGGATWETCSLRKYLNNDFLNTFSWNKSKISLTTNINTPNQWRGTNCGNNTSDYIFCLSLSEVVKYFGDSGQLKKIPILSNGYEAGMIDDKYNLNRIAKYEGRNAWWWLRSLGYNEYNAAVVDSEGRIEVLGWASTCVEPYGGVRPALWIHM